MSQKKEQALNGLYRFIADYIGAHGFAPALREISEHCAISQSTAVRYLDVLQARGLLRRQEGLARCLVLTPPKSEKSGQMLHIC